VRVLLVSLRPPTTPPDGLSLIVAALVHRLGTSHDIRLLAFEPPSGATSARGGRLVPPLAQSLPARVARLAASVVRREPAGVRALARRMRPALREELQAFEPDVVHVFSGRLALVAADVGDRPLVLSAIDAWHLNVDARAELARGMRRWMLRMEATNARRFEARSYRRADRVVVVTADDRRALLALAPDLAVDVIPNGVDVPPAVTYERRPGTIAFHGVMSYPPNVLAAVCLAHEVLPLVRRSLPGAEAVIIGRDPSPEVRELAAIDGVTVTGAVDDVFAWIGGADVYACPVTTGTGIKNKVLEAMAAGAACVATPLAVQGLDVASGREYVEAVDPSAMADAIVRLLGDDAGRARLGAAARAHVTAAHSWDAVARDYGAAYEQVVSARRRRRD
jgi:glycosyltransferase involved in cell wall biosynthesis